MFTCKFNYFVIDHTLRYQNIYKNKIEKKK